MSILVKNIPGTFKLELDGFSNLKEFWELKKEKHSILCSNIECWNVSEVGSYVQSESDEIGLVPLCKRCTTKTKDFEIYNEDLLRLFSKSELEYREVVKSIKLFIESRIQIRKDIEKRIYMYQLDPVYSNLSDYINQIISDEKKLLDSIETQLKNAEEILDTLLY